MTQIRIRHELDAKAQILGDVPLDQIDTVIPTIQSWGITTPYSDYPEGMFGQFVYTDTGAYFEVVVSDESEDTPSKS